MLLAIDTSAGTSVAVVDRDGGILAEHSSDDPRGHAERIGDFIQASLADAGVRPADLSGVAVGMGPGPFTGLRVGIAAARTFALGIRRPVVPIVSHDAIAFGHPRPALVVTDARRRELFWSRYDAPDDLGLPVRLAGPAIVAAADLETLRAEAAGDLLDGGLVRAGSLGLLAESLFEHGRPFAANAPLYLRSPDVTLAAAPKRVTG